MQTFLQFSIIVFSISMNYENVWNIPTKTGDICPPKTLVSAHRPPHILSIFFVIAHQSEDWCGNPYSQVRKLDCHNRSMVQYIYRIWVYPTQGTTDPSSLFPVFSLEGDKIAA